MTSYSTRRRAIFVSAVLVALLSMKTAVAVQSFPDIKPAPQQTQWQDLEFGVILHFGTNTFLNREWGDGTASPKIFNPTQFDPDQWMSAIQASGARYVVLVAKHHGSAGRTYDFPKIIETLRTYQPNTMVFADTALFEYGDIRWAGSETGKIDYENWNVIDRHGYLRWRPVEVDTPLHKLHWFWHSNDEASLKTVDELLGSYENSVGHGGQWMLGVAPDERGLLPDADVVRLHEIGGAIRTRYADNLLRAHAPVDENTANALDGDDATFWTAPANSNSSMLEVHLAHPITFNTALTMEWLNVGQTIQRYRIEVWQHDAWVTVVDGYAIGTKKLIVLPR